MDTPSYLVAMGSNKSCLLKTHFVCLQVPHGGYEDYSMYITLSPDHVHILQSFVLTGDQRHIHDVSEILIAMVNRIVSSRMGRMEKAIEWVESKIGISLHRLLQVSEFMETYLPFYKGDNRGRQHSFVEIDHEIFSTVILSLPLIQEGQLSVSGERMCTVLVNRLED